MLKILRLLVPASATLLVSLVWYSNANAGGPPPEGRLLGSQCFQCHGTNGKGSGFSTFLGKSSTEIYNTLYEMSQRPVESIMDRHARGYTDQQLHLLADYLSTLN
jgi:cytochrome c553